MTENNDATNDTTNAGADAGYFSEEAATFGDRVAAARRAVGMDQLALSRKLGIKLKTLHAWEEDISEPRANKLQMLAGVLNASIIWLLTGEGQGVDDPWEEDTNPDASADRYDLADVITDLRLIRSEYARLGERMARLEKRLSKAQKAGS